MANAHYFGPFLRQWGVGLVSATKNMPVHILLEDGAGVAYTGAVAAGDVKVSKDGGAEANIGTLPTHIAGGIWSFILSGTELQASAATIRIAKAGIALTVIGIQTRLALGQLHVSAIALGAFGGTADVAALTLEGAGTQPGLTALGGVTNGSGIVLAAQGNGHGIQSSGLGTGSGFFGVAGATGKISNFLDAPEGTEPIAAPGVNSTAMQILQFAKRRFYNKVTQTITTQTIYRDDNNTALCTLPCSDDGSTQTKGRAV